MAKHIWLLIGVFAAGCSDDQQVSPDFGQKDSRVDLSSDLGVDARPDLGVDAPPPDLGPPEPRIVILHTNDLHDHLVGWSPNTDYTPGFAGDDLTVGGFARLAAVIDAQRKSAGNAPVLLLDGGDFSMGTLFTWIGPTKAPTLSLMQALGYDAGVIGNHELEWGVPALASRVAAAAAAGVNFPLLSSNMVFDAASPVDDGLKQQYDAGRIRMKHVKTLKNGRKIGLFGLMGAAAAAVSFEAAPLTFADPVARASAMVAELRDVDKVDFVICLSHGGIDTAGKGADEKLAAAVPGIDVIISSHTHDALSQPVKVGQTLIVQAGKFGKHLGRLELELDGAAIVSSKYELINIDDGSLGDTKIHQQIDGFIADVDAMLAPDGLAFRKVVAETTFDLTEPELAESTLGNLITDAFRHAIDAAQPGAPVDFAAETGGMIRDEVRAGKTGQIWFADLFRAVPLGLTPDNKPGYPLVTYYLTGKEIKTWMEMLPLAATYVQTGSLFFQVSGIEVVYSNLGLPFSSVQSVKLVSGAAPVEIKDSTDCYKVASTIFVAEQLALAKTISLGLLKIEPKEQDCQTLVTHLEQRAVDADPTAAGVQHLTPWRALVDYLSQLPDLDSDGVPDIPSSYSQPQGRITAN